MHGAPVDSSDQGPETPVSLGYEPSLLPWGEGTQTILARSGTVAI